MKKNNCSMHVVTGRVVTSSNTLHKEWGTGVVQQVRSGQAKVEFYPTVFSRHPYVVESKIIDISDLKVVKLPAERIADGEFEDTWKFELKQRAAHLLVCNRDGQLSNARTDLVPHQITIAHEVVSNPRRRYLIADEVGLGKTIETGLIFYALAQKGKANRVLIITPAGLTLQWQEEMKEKFDSDFVVYKEDVRGPLAFDYHDRIIASIDTLKLDRPLKRGGAPGHKTMILGSRRWDLIIFDEAHKLSAKTWSEQKTEKTLSFRLAEELQEHCDALLLLTATPHQGDESKFQNLVGLLHPNVTFDEWARKSEGAVFYTDLILRNRKSKVTDPEGKLIFKGMEIHPIPVALRTDGERQFHAALEEYLREGYGFAEQDPKDKRHKAIGFVMTIFQKMAASSTGAIKKALGRRRDKLQKQRPSKQVDELVEYDARCEGEREERKAAKTQEQFIDTEVEMLDQLIGTGVAGDAKRDELLKLIESMSQDNPHEKVLIFTEYIETQEFIKETLEGKYGQGSVVLIRGQRMTLYDKKRSQEAFRDDPGVRFLVSTEAGAEGINLQFCHLMVNYDLPWNPFRLAQRYGRLYRYGQEYVVQSFNFQNTGTIEDKVRDYLEQKTKTAAQRLSKITGETTNEIEEGLLGLFDEFLDYDKIYREGLVKRDLKPSKQVIDEGVKKAEQAYRLAYSSLFSKNIAPFNPERFRHEIKSPLTLEHVEQFIAEFVRRQGRAFTKTQEGDYEFLLPNRLQGRPGLERRYRNVTFDRARAIRHSHLEFMAMGHPFTDAAIAYSGTVEFGGFCARRVVEHAELRGTRGIQFNFIVKLTKRASDGEDVWFELVPMYMKPNGSFDDQAAKIALIESGSEPKADADFSELAGLAIVTLEQRAREAVVGRFPDAQLWDEDVVCLNAAQVVFV